MGKQAPERIWAEERFWPNVDTVTKSPCWMWTGSTLGKGYGAVQPQKGTGRVGAHRFSWALHNGRWPKENEVVMHSCDNPYCVNPKHLSVGSQSDNMQDCVRKGRHKPFIPPTKTHCVNGHKYTPENTQYVMDRGKKQRRCATCHREQLKAWRASK